MRGPVPRFLVLNHAKKFILKVFIYKIECYSILFSKDINSRQHKDSSGKNFKIITGESRSYTRDVCFSDVTYDRDNFHGSFEKRFYVPSRLFYTYTYATLKRKKIFDL